MNLKEAIVIIIIFNFAFGFIMTIAINNELDKLSPTADTKLNSIISKENELFSDGNKKAESADSNAQYVRTAGNSIGMTNIILESLWRGVDVLNIGMFIQVSKEPTIIGKWIIFAFIIFKTIFNFILMATIILEIIKG